MESAVRIPMFPLSILPLPGELIPLHIFEPRYRQLLQDLETKDATFGIYCTHEVNGNKLGSLMRLESVIKRYPGGESDIIVKCEDIFSLDVLFRTYKDKLYPGGDVLFWNTDQGKYPKAELYEMFIAYLRFRNIQQHFTSFNLYQIAQELNMDVNERYKFLTTGDRQKEYFLINRIKFQLHLLKEEEKSKDLFHLN